MPRPVRHHPEGVAVEDHEVGGPAGRKRSALREGAEIQRDVLAGCAEVAVLGLALVERGLKSARGDAGSAVFLAAGAARSAAADSTIATMGVPAGRDAAT